MANANKIHFFAEHIRHAAEDGPVIIVNASMDSCDPLIVPHTGPPIHVPLPCSIYDVDQLCIQLSELTQDPHAYGENRVLGEANVAQYLVVRGRTICLCFAERHPAPSGSHIWWRPTSKLTVLPLHAAGPYQKGQMNMMDIYVSSYAPLLSGLIRTRERAHAQREARAASGVPDVIAFAAVGQARPKTDANLSGLVEVEHEIERIRDETGMPRNTKFETVQTFRDHRRAHIACHGAQHAEKPFESWFAMNDGKLTLMRIIQERYGNSEFAFLSACHTAFGDESTPDEVLHLATGMQFAGFNGLIGTLWKVDDAVAHQLVTRFYKEMFNHPVIGFENAAASLNTAALETTEVSLEKQIVFVHIGI